MPWDRDWFSKAEGGMGCRKDGLQEHWIGRIIGLVL
jgi:hypothetical protein